MIGEEESLWAEIKKRFPLFYKFLFDLNDKEEIYKREQYILKFVYNAELSIFPKICSYQHESYDNDYIFRLYNLYHSLRKNEELINEAITLYTL